MDTGSDPAIRCLRGTSALHHAAEANRMDSIAAILKCADAQLVLATDEMGWTALHYAALHQLPESGALLIQARRFFLSDCTPQWYGYMGDSGRVLHLCAHLLGSIH